nr:hypothetical protein [Lachnospiraceae bacterium]
MDFSDLKNIEEIRAMFPDDPDKYADDREQYEIVSRVGYMIGIFEDKYRSDHSMDYSVYSEMKNDKNATIIRDLCTCRTFAERNYKKIYTAIRDEYKSIFMLPELMPQNNLYRLQKNDVDLYQHRNDPLDFIMRINSLIKERVDNCKYLFPDWLNWSYLKEIFIMPNGNTEVGCKEEAEYYFKYINKYPHKMYIYWPAMEDFEGYLLRNDREFICDLYHWHSDEFTDLSRVSDVSER